MSARVTPVLSVSPADAAVMLSVSRQHIYKLIADGELRRVLVGRAARIPVEDIYRVAGITPRTEVA
jgi:excisionase family DNA binding protein